MEDNNQTYTIFEAGWVVRIRPPEKAKTQRVMLLIHGWTGDENVMWLFARHLTSEYAIFAPRGPVDAPEGFGWAPLQQDQPTYLADLTEPVEQLLAQMARWMSAYKISPDVPVDIMGFSQGAALVYTLLLKYPQRIRRAAALAGFLPADAQEALHPGLLAGKQVFIAHGTQDDTIPVARALQAIDALQDAGADITYCEESVGHKLGMECYRRLGDFFI